MNDFINSYIFNIRTAWNSRSKTSVNWLKPFVLLGIVFTILYILIALIAIPKGAGDNYNFVDERGAITALSAVYIAMASAFSFVHFTFYIKGDKHLRWMWLLFALGFGMLALDELLQFHERLGNLIGSHINSGPFRNWNDVIVIGYGIFALIIALPLAPLILKHKWLPEFIVVAFLFFFIHTTVDSLAEPSTVLSTIIEESAKLFCMFFIMQAIFCSLMVVISDDADHTLQ